MSVKGRPGSADFESLLNERARGVLAIWRREDSAEFVATLIQANGPVLAHAVELLLSEKAKADRGEPFASDRVAALAGDIDRILDPDRKSLSASTTILCGCEPN